MGITMTETSKQKKEKDKRMAYDDILLYLGEFGTYQKRIYLLLCLPAIICALHKLGGSFLMAKAENRCLLPFEHQGNATFSDISEELKRMCYPWDELGNNFSSCKMYDTNYNREYFLNNITAHQTVSCNQWVYNKATYHSTVLMEWDLVCDKAWLKATSDSFFMTGVLVGSIVFGALSDKYGRRPVFFISLVVQVIAGILVGVAPDFYTYTLFRTIVGATTSGVFLVAYVIALEMVGPKKRMFAGVACQMFFSTGILILAVLAYFIRDWRPLQFALTLPGVIFFSYYWFIPESARWLLTQGRQQEAKLIVLAAAKENKVSIPNDILDNLLAPLEEEQKKKEPSKDAPTLLDLFKYPNLRKKALIIFFLWFVNCATYYGLTWNTSSLKPGNDYIMFFISGLVEYPAYTFLLLTLNRWGRKLIQCGCMLAGGSALLLTIFFARGTVGNIVLTMIGKMAITASYGTVYVFSAEQFPTVVRNVGIGASSTFARVGAILAPYVNITEEIWKPLPTLIFGGCALFGGIMALILPETHNKTLPDSIEDGEKFGKKSNSKVVENGDMQ